MKEKKPATTKAFIIILIYLALKMNIALTQNSPTGMFDNSTDIGDTKLPGSTEYNPDTQVYTLRGAGENIWFDKDGFHLLWKKLKGDFIIRVRMRFSGDGVHEHRKAGIMIRDSLTTNSVHVSGVVHGDGLTSLQYRKITGNDTEETRSELTYPDIIQVERRGDIYILSVARSGEKFKTIEIADIRLNNEVYAGLFICSHNAEVLEEAVFENVRIIIPADENFIPYTDYIGSNIEILDIETGLRKILHSSPKSLQAPNWSNDGKTLVFNSEGFIYSFNLDNRTVNKINTDFAIINNNDHVLSFDGKFLGISHHSAEDDNRSVIYILPAGGGNPERITAKSPSYLHGWSPDDEFLVYTGGRNDNYDIYRISRYKKEEIRLTASTALDDGPEYTPDGKYIYFNSNRTGTMQIWRMKPDGSEQEQMTFDELNDWFPHISPDGKQVAFISFPEEVDSGDHPFYKHVYIRIMPVNGGEPKIVSYIYGGQGTMNVPSWSPDSKRIAFISNTSF